MAIQETTVKTITCKNCGSEAVVKFGTYKGIQRYWCKSCNRKFKSDADTFHMKVPSEYVSSALNMYYSGMSFNDIRNHLKQEHGYYPSKSVIYQWVQKYTDKAREHFKDYHPDVGEVWIADETMLDVDGQHKIWFYDIIDEKTRYLLASRVALSRTTHDAESLMREASKRAGGVIPEQIITDANYSYLDGIKLTFGSETEHVKSRPFISKDSTNTIERFHGVLKDRTKVIRSFKDIDTLIQFTDGWSIITTSNRIKRLTVKHLRKKLA
jgi:putative transposase